MRFKQRMLPLSLAMGVALASPLSHAEVMVNLFQWNYLDVAKECETVLAPKGVGAIHLASPVERVQGSQWWQAFMPVNLDNFTTSAGNEAEFKSMLTRCNAAGVKVFVNAPLNHMAAGKGVGTGGSTYDASAYQYPQFSSEDFHHLGPIRDYMDRQQVQQGDLAGLPDLDTGSPKVQELLAKHLKQLREWGVSGFRIDAGKHIAASELAEILRQAGNPEVYTEVIGVPAEPIQPTEYTGLGRVEEYAYARKLREYFNGRLSEMKDLESDAVLLPGTQAKVFVTQWDLERGSGNGSLTYRSGSQYRLANVLMLAWPYGSPVIHSSYQFQAHDDGAPKSAACDAGWNCEQRDPMIANMVLFNNLVGQNPVTNWWDDGDNQIAFGRGDKGFVVVNNSQAFLDQTLQTNLPAGEYCNILAGNDYCSGDYIQVAADGKAHVKVAPGQAMALLAGYLRNGEVAFPSLNLRGSFNNWENIPLSRDANTGLWSADVLFNGEGDLVAAQHFRFDVYGNGELIYGDNEGDGIADQGSRHDIFFNGIGKYRVTFNESDQRYTLTKLAGGLVPPVAVVDPQQLTLTAGASVMFDGRKSTDADGKIVSYHWTMSENSKCSGIKCGEPYPLQEWEGSDTAMVKFEQPGLYEVALSVVDDSGLSSVTRAWITVIPPEWHDSIASKFIYRGTSNSWGEQPLTLVADNTWQTEVTFTDRKNQRFKLDATMVTANGEERVFSYGDKDNNRMLDSKSAVQVAPFSGRYKLTVNDLSMRYTLKRLDKPFKHSYPALYLTGSNNNWGKSAMQLVADNTWYIKTQFGGKTPRQFRLLADTGIRTVACQSPVTTDKLIADCGCAKSNPKCPQPVILYGDNKHDGIADKNGKPITVPTKGEVLIKFNEKTRRYSIEMP